MVDWIGILGVWPVATLASAIPFFGRAKRARADSQLPLEVHPRIQELERENEALKAELSQFKGVQIATLIRFQTTFYELPLPCFTVDGRGHVMEWNRACEAFFFRPEHEAVDRPITEILGTGIFRNDAEGMIYMVFMGMHPAPIAIDLFVEGRKRTVKWHASPIKDRDGLVVGALNTLGVLPEFENPGD